MKDIQVTLYDVFGYIFPGATFLAAMFLGYWTAFLPLDQDLTKLTGAGWIFVLMVAYVSGHLVQALANLVARLRPSNVDLVLDPSTGTIPTEVVQAAHARARALIGSPQDVNLAAQTVFEICDHYVQKEGETATRDMYVYRKGFEDVQNSVETRGSPELVVYAAWAWAGGGGDSLPSWSSNFGKCR